MRDQLFTIKRPAGCVTFTPPAEGWPGRGKAKRFIALLTVLVAVPVFGQTKLDLKTQGKNIDFSASTSTRPAKTGTILPAQCLAGDLFFKTDAAAGSNMYGCVAANTWAPQGAQSVPTISGQSGKVLSNDGTSLGWTALGGDISSAPGTAVVVGLQGRAVANTAPSSGQAMAWNATAQRWEPQTISGGGGGGGSLAIEADGTSVGTRGTMNFQGGNGVTLIGSDTGSKIQVQYLSDTAVLQTKAAAQAGVQSYCASADANGSAYSCGLAPTLLAYTAGMILNWRPDVANAASATLNVDLLGAVPLRRFDGSAVAAGDAQAGRIYPLSYDGSGFRIVAAGSSSGGGGTALGTLSRIWCPLGNCQTSRNLRMGVVAGRTYFFRFTPDRARTVRRVAVPLYPWGGLDTLSIGIYNAAGAKQAECNSRVNGVNISAAFQVCTFPSTITIDMDTDYYLVIASETATPQLDCTADGNSYELHTLWAGRPDLFPGNKTMMGYGANSAAGTGAAFALPATLGSESSAALCFPQFYTFPQ